MKLRGVALVALTLLSVAACSSPEESPSAPATTPEPLTVFAAASLNASFTEIGDQYTAETGQEVRFSFAGSSDLVSQLEAGAPADVFASANQTTMDAAGDLVESPTVFVTNTLVIVAAPGNPEGIEGIGDLANDALATVICAPQVPCGEATQTLAADNDVAIAAVSEESSVTDVLAKVSTGEADAGVVYRTDAATQPELATVEIAGADQVVNEYPIAAVRDSTQPQAAQDFIAFVTGPQGVEVLTEAGFERP